MDRRRWLSFKGIRWSDPATTEPGRRALVYDFGAMKESLSADFRARSNRQAARRRLARKRLKNSGDA